MNKTIQGILLTEYRVSKRDLEDKKQALDRAVKDRALRESLLSSARNHETLVAEDCQRAADRLRDIADYLKANGVYL